MRFNFLGGPAQEEDTVIKHVDVWWDESKFRTWCVTVFNKDGDPVGENYHYRLKKDARRLGKDIAEWEGAKLRVFTRDGRIC